MGAWWGGGAVWGCMRGWLQGAGLGSLGWHCLPASLAGTAPSTCHTCPTERNPPTPAQPYSPTHATPITQTTLNNTTLYSHTTPPKRSAAMLELAPVQRYLKVAKAKQTRSPVVALLQLVDFAQRHADYDAVGRALLWLAGGCPPGRAAEWQQGAW